MAPKNKSPKNSECVRVVIRCRPLNDTEKKQGHSRCVEMNSKRGLVEITKAEKSSDKKSFTFDAVYDWDSKQGDLYDETFRDLVQCVLDGFNGTIFAYGQTGTGKTFTMQGVKSDKELAGVIPRSFEHIFSHISSSENQQYLVRASYLEIYMEEIRDLLAKDQNTRLELKERPDTGVYVKDLSSFVTKSIKEIEHVMNVGNQNRSVGSTNMNAQSSRSHAIFIITIECSEMGADKENHIRVGKLNLVDLAGSERQGKSGAEGERLREATKINLSLSALGNVISALVDGKTTHIPYRDSKLTRLLQDSLGGNAKTVMVANIGPAGWNSDETITTLRYANRAKNIKNKPKINEDPKDALLREFQDEIERLKAALGESGGGGKRKKKRKNADGTEASEDDDGDEAEAFKEEQQSKLEEEKLRIMNDKSMISEEKTKLLDSLKEKKEKIEMEKQARDQLAVKLQNMQSKLLIGSYVEHTSEQKRALDARKKEILEKEKKEREIQQKLEEEDENALNLQETYQSLQQEVEVKTKKLKKLYGKLQATKREIADVQEAHVRERQELEHSQEELMRELKLKLLIIENFIPPEEKNKIMNRMVFNEEEDVWSVRSIANQENPTMATKPASATGHRRPTSEYAQRAAVLENNPRYKGENILLVELDMPNRTTRDWDGPDVAPKLKHALDSALQDEEDIDIDADGNPSIFSGKNRKKCTNFTGKIKSTQKKREEMFPTSRGLVPK